MIKVLNLDWNSFWKDFVCLLLHFGQKTWTYNNFNFLIFQTTFIF